MNAFVVRSFARWKKCRRAILVFLSLVALAGFARAELSAVAASTPTVTPSTTDAAIVSPVTTAAPDVGPRMRQAETSFDAIHSPTGSVNAGVDASSPSATGSSGAQNYFSTTHLSPTETLLFGTTVEDPYRWLENGESEKVKSWNSDEDRTAREFLSNLRVRPALKQRLKDLMADDDVSLPSEANGRIFFARRSVGKDKPTLYWRTIGGDDTDHVLLKPFSIADEFLGQWSVSPDAKQCAYIVRNAVSDEAILHVRNVDTWKENPVDLIPGADVANVSWTDNSTGFYYVRLPTGTSLRHADRLGQAKVYFHTLGVPVALDPEIFPETHSSTQILSPHLSSDGQWLFISAINDSKSTNIFFREVQNSSSTFKPLFVSTAATANITESGGILYILTNDGAPNYEIKSTFVREPYPSSWKVLVPERPDTRILSMRFVLGSLVLTIARDDKVGLEIRNLDGTLRRTVLEPTLGEIGDIRSSESSDTLYFDFDSIVVPRQIYRLSVQNGTLTTWWAPRHPIDASRYEGLQVNYHSKGGAPLRMVIVKRKGMPMDGSAPFLMEGNAGFGTLEFLRYSPMIIPWLEAGGGYAVPNIRSGDDTSASADSHALAQRHQTMFDDFIAAAQYLIEMNYTRKERLAIEGESDGGLLMGAVMTQRPDLFRAVICKKPLFDMIRYPLFGDGEAWLRDYGSPEIEDDFRALISYSPYHHVKSGTAYPGMLIVAAQEGDPIDPMHARKMTAALQAATTSFHPILLETERNTAHGGPDSTQSRLEDYLDRLSFLMNAMRLKLSH